MSQPANRMPLIDALKALAALLVRQITQRSGRRLGLGLGFSAGSAGAIGVLAAVRPHGWFDRIAMAFTYLGISFPVYWIGLLLIVVFAVTLQWLPPSGVGNPGQPWYLSLQFLILPTATIALSNLSVFSRFVSP